MVAGSELYIIKDNRMAVQPGTTTDGGETWDFDDDVAGASQKRNAVAGTAIYKNTKTDQTAKAIDSSWHYRLHSKENTGRISDQCGKAEPETETGGTDGETAEDKSYSGRASRATTGENIKGTRTNFGTHSYPSTLKQSKWIRYLN